MAVCMFWLLTYVGQGLDLAVGNRPVIIVQGTGQEAATDYRHHGLRKKSDLSPVVGSGGASANGGGGGGGGGNLLHLRIYPTDLSSSSSSSSLSHRDDPWLLLNEEPRMTSWSPILIEDMFREPRDLQTVFFALSPAVMNLLHNEPAQIGDPFLHEAHNQQQQQQQQRKKLRIDCKHSRSTVSPPILVCDDRREPRQSRNYEEMFDHHRAKTELTHPRDYQNSGVVGVGASSGGTTGTGGGVGVGVGVGVGAGPFLSKPPPSYGYEAVKPPGKRSQRGSIGRRSVGHSGESGNSGHQGPGAGGNIASQLMLRSTRGSIQYDVPQIECPVSEDGMERFACPTADRMGRYHCIDDHVLCDGFIDCPTGEDEDRQACMFYKTTKAHLDVLADAILRWARGR